MNEADRKAMAADRDIIGVCPNCDQWQRRSNGNDCMHGCISRRLALPNVVGDRRFSEIASRHVRAVMAALDRDMARSTRITDETLGASAAFDVACHYRRQYSRLQGE